MVLQEARTTFFPLASHDNSRFYRWHIMESWYQENRLSVNTSGNYLSIYGVLLLGQSIAYPSVQTSLLVSGLWGILYYRELKGKQIIVWIASAIVALGGVVVLSQVH